MEMKHFVKVTHKETRFISLRKRLALNLILNVSSEKTVENLHFMLYVIDVFFYNSK